MALLKSKHMIFVQDGSSKEVQVLKGFMACKIKDYDLIHTEFKLDLPDGSNLTVHGTIYTFESVNPILLSKIREFIPELQ